MRKSSRNVAKIKTWSWEESQDDGFKIKYLGDTIGRGILAKRCFEKGSFLLPYQGRLLDREPEDDDTYIFEFSHTGKTYWIDATKEDGTLGRLINDDHVSPNCFPKSVVINAVPAIGFFAQKNIKEGEELRYCYGSKMECYPWRKMKEKQKHQKVVKNIEEEPNTDIEMKEKQKHQKVVKNIEEEPNTDIELKEKQKHQKVVKNIEEEPNTDIEMKEKQKHQKVVKNIEEEPNTDIERPRSLDELTFCGLFKESFSVGKGECYGL